MHELVARVLHDGDDNELYLIQDRDPIEWLQRDEMKLGSTIAKLLPDIGNPVFKKIDIDKVKFKFLEPYDIIICSNAP
jgi:hypothetical protein